jgi:hypothetical protein
MQKYLFEIKTNMTQYSEIDAHLNCNENMEEFQTKNTHLKSILQFQTVPFWITKETS